MNKFRVLFVDDDEELTNDLKGFFELEEYNNNKFGIIKITAECCQSFDHAIELCKVKPFDLIVLDLMKGDSKADTKGLDVFSSIKNNFFAPVIFFSGFAGADPTLQDYSTSKVVSVISKGNTNLLKTTVREIIENPASFAFLSKTVTSHLRDELKEFFWSHVHDEREKINEYGRDDYSLNYLFLKKLAHSLSTSKIKELTGDNLIQLEKAHPMEFYIYPTTDGDYEPGEILQDNSDKTYYVLLTPACDLVNSRIKVDNVLLSKTIVLEDSPEYKKYQSAQSKSNLSDLKSIITNNQNYSNKSFFIPKTYFIPNLVAKFDDIISVKINDLAQYQRIAKLDAPFTQSLITKFTSCYNRIGTADIDVGHILGNLTVIDNP